MPDKFKGSGSITLYPGDVNVPLVLRFPPATGSTKNDGAVPYGSTIISQTVVARYLDSSTTGTTGLIEEVASVGQAVTVFLTHDSSASIGLHSVIATVKFSLSGSALEMTRPFDLDRVWVK